MNILELSDVENDPRIERHLRRLVHIGTAAIGLLLVWFLLDVVWNLI